MLAGRCLKRACAAQRCRGTGVGPGLGEAAPVCKQNASMMDFENSIRLMCFTQLCLMMRDVVLESKPGRLKKKGGVGEGIVRHIPKGGLTP